MNKFKILEKREIDGYDCFTLFDEYNKVACITDFAIASGTFDYENIDHLRSSNYWVNESSELDYRFAYGIDINGNMKLFSKVDKYIAGLRVAGNYSDVKKYIIEELKINDNISVGKFGYFPNKILTETFNPQKIINTGVNFQLPVINEPMLSTFDLSYNPIYEYNGKFILNYENQKLYSKLSDNQIYYYKEDAIFELEPIRIWIDKKHNLILTQDIIMAGVAFKSGFDKCEYDDYTESDIYRALSIFENNIERSMDLYDNAKIKRKKCK